MPMQTEQQILEQKRSTGYKDQAASGKPQIAIIIPAFNAHNTIKKTLSSIAMQDNIDEIETIIVDDCSHIGYDEIATKFAHMMKIKIVKMTKNGGPGAARQVGIDHSEAPFLTCIDADDCFLGCDAINTLKLTMINKDQDCVYGQFLEQNENLDLVVHELHMVWVFGKMYRRSFLERFNIRFNTSLSNEDTGFNSLIRGCTTRIWYIPKPVYIWRFKENSITRINQGMYGFDSGYKGYIDNMIWQLKELNKRFVNRNYILDETIAIMNVLYHFHVENMERYPLNTEASMNWIRGFYELCYKDIAQYVTPDRFKSIAVRVHAEQNIAVKGIIPKMTLDEFMEEVCSVPPVKNGYQEVGGATEVCHIPEITDENWPVVVTGYMDLVENAVSIDSNTNLSRQDGMNRMIGITESTDETMPVMSGVQIANYTTIDLDATDVSFGSHISNAMNTIQGVSKKQLSSYNDEQ